MHDFLRVEAAILFNLPIVLLVVPWLARQLRGPAYSPWLLPALLFKIVACGVSCWFLTQDATALHYWADAFSRKLWHEPLQWLLMLPTDTYHFRRGHIVYHGLSSTFFHLKLMSFLRTGSDGNLFIEAFLPTLFSFVGGWQLVRTFQRLFPASPRGSVVVGWLLWPTVVYWTSGLTKESLLVGSGAWLLALVLPWLYGGEKVRPLPALGAILLAYLHFKMRFFFAVPLFAALVGLAAVRLAQRLGWARTRVAQALVFAAMLLGGARAASELSPAFTFNKFSSQLLKVYGDILAHSQGRPHIEYADLRPTAASVLQNTPKAVFSALLRPLPGESRSPLYVGVALENLALLALMTVAVVALWRGRGGQLPFALVLALGVYCLALAALMGLSTPNLGTLNRYRSSLLPVVLLLTLQNDYAARLLRRLGL